MSAGAMRVRARRMTGLVEVAMVKARSVKRSTIAPTGARSGWWVSSTAGSAMPRRVWTSFQPRLAASWMPVFMPCAPAGGVDVCGVAGEEDPAGPVSGGGAVV